MEMIMEDVLNELEDKYYGEFEESREAIIAELEPIHRETLSKGLDAFREFEEEVIHRFGGAYLPYVFWVELSQFMDKPETRKQLADILECFVNSDFDEEDTRRMKSLLIIYLALEKEFEVDKIEGTIIAKSHPKVIEFFGKVKGFVEKNKASVDMYLEKFRMLRNHYPDFDLLRLPLIRLKEQLQ
jgi:hypothetical protein